MLKKHKYQPEYIEKIQGARSSFTFTFRWTLCAYAETYDGLNYLCARLEDDPVHQEGTVMDKHTFKPGYSGMVCEHMVMRNEGGDSCGEPANAKVHNTSNMNKEETTMTTITCEQCGHHHYHMNCDRCGKIATRELPVGIGSLNSIAPFRLCEQCWTGLHIYLLGEERGKHIASATYNKDDPTTSAFFIRGI